MELQICTQSEFVSGPWSRDLFYKFNILKQEKKTQILPQITAMF